MISPSRLSDSVAIITGAASGIGRAVALELAAHNARLALVDIDEAGLESLRDELSRRPGVKTIRADLRDSSARERVVSETLDHFGRVDVLFNNAGVGILAMVEHTSLDDWNWLFDLNVWAPIHMTQLCLPHMMERRSGHIVNIASVAGLVGVSCLTAYSVTKFAMVGFSEGLRGEVCDFGIDVSVVCPGHVRTKIVESARNSFGGETQSFLPDWYSGWPVDRAARTIVRGILLRKPRILVGPEAALLYRSKQLLPESPLWLGRWFARRCRGLQQPVPHSDRSERSPVRIIDKKVSSVR